jgi:hypothetical protein
MQRTSIHWRRSRLRAILATALFLMPLPFLAPFASAQETSDIRETIGAYVKGTTTHAQFQADIQRGKWEVGMKQIRSTQNLDKTWTLSILYRVYGTKAASCSLEFKGPIEDKTTFDIGQVPLLSASC